MSSCLRFFTLLLACVTLSVGGAASVWAEEAAPVKSEAGDKETKKDEKKSDKKEEGGESDAAKKPPDGTSGGRFAGDPIYIHLAPMVMPIITDSGLEQIVTIAIDIQVKDFDTADTVHSNMPRVMDALMRGLYGGLGEGNLRNGKLVNITKIKNKATRALTEVIPGDGIKDVLIQGVAQRMF